MAAWAEATVFGGNLDPKNFRERLKNPWAKEVYAEMLARGEEDLGVSADRLFLHVDAMAWYTLSWAWEAGSRILRLAFLWQVTGEERYRKKCMELCLLHLSREEDWNVNPAHDLVYDTFLIPMAIAVDWVKSDTEEYRRFRGEMLRGFGRMLGILDEWFEKRIIRSNHAVISHVPYAVMACVFPENSAAGKWWEFATTGLEKWVFDGVSVGPDGDWHEGCFDYQNFLLFHLMFVFELARERGEDYYARPQVRAMFECLIQGVTPDHGLVNFNDNFHKDGYGQSMLTSGVAMLKGGAEYQDGKLVWAAEYLRGNIEWDRFCCQFGDVATLLMVPFERLPAAEEPAAAVSRLRSTGYVCVRDGWGEGGSLFALATLPWSAASRGYPLRQGHSHLDAGSFEFYFRGVPVSMEPGYLWYPIERISPAYHNTVSADGRPAPFNEWSTPSDVYGTLIGAEGDAERFVAQVDLKDFLKIKRAVRTIVAELKRGRISWTDELEDDDEHVYKSYYHGMGRSELKEGKYIFERPRCVARLTLEADGEMAVSTGRRPTTINYRGLNSSLLEKDVIWEPASTVEASVRGKKVVIRWALEVAVR